MSRDKIEELKKMGLLDDETAKRSDELLNKLSEQAEDDIKDCKDLIAQIRLNIS